METLEFGDRKSLRAGVILRHVQEVPSYRGVVCFSCGNAYASLMAAFVPTTGVRHIPVVGVATNGDLSANRWFTPEMIANTWPGFFDATSGHLCPQLMARLADVYKGHLGTLPMGTWRVPTGSGETIVALAMAFPNHRFLPIYNCGPGTLFHPEAPLNQLVRVIGGAHGGN